MAEPGCHEWPSQPKIAIILLLCITYATVAAEEGPRHQQDLTNMAQQLGVHPKALMSASRLANRQPGNIVRLLQVNPSATLTATGAIVFGCGLHPETADGVMHINSPGTPHFQTHPHHQNQQQQQQRQQEQQQRMDLLPPVKGQEVWDETDLEKAFKLHSRPSASRKIVLEFNGCVTEGIDGWNKYYGIDKITTPPYDTDGHTDSFSNSEKSDIITMHGAVAEAFSPWDVDVTTEDPGVDGLERADEQDEHYGIRMCVGGDSYWTNTSIGGIATLNNFGWINAPGGEVFRDSFVFSLMLTEADGSMNLGYIWKSIVHEIGHTLGLVHKGFKLPDGSFKEYYTIPPNPSMWAPVMGVPGRGLYVHWSNGEYRTGVESSNFDDELEIIQRTLSRVPDEGVRGNLTDGTNSTDGANSTTTAIGLCVDSICTDDSTRPGWVTSTVLGKIAHPQDQDLYQLTVATAGPFNVQVIVHGNWRQSMQNGTKEVTWRVSGLRPLVVVEQQGANVVATTNADPLTWQHDYEVTVPEPGTYTFAVQPTGVLDANSTQVLPSTYGNLGSYQLTVTWPHQAMAT